MHEHDHPEVHDTPLVEVKLSNRLRKLLLPPPTEAQVETLSKWDRQSRQRRRRSCKNMTMDGSFAAAYAAAKAPPDKEAA